MPGKQTQPGMGWLRDLPSFKDYTIEKDKLHDRVKLLGKPKTRTIKGMVKELKTDEPGTKKVKSKIDLRDWCSPIENQLDLGSCTAHAGVGIMEYYEKRAFGKHINASRLFLYKTTRNLLEDPGDNGAFLRTTIGAMALFGVPPEKYFPYSMDYKKEPSAFCYSYAQNYQSIQYFRLDDLKTSKTALLKRIKLFLSAGLPSMFGFTVFDSIYQAKNNGGKIPYPCWADDTAGGHAIVAIGYDDNLKIKNQHCGEETKGALLIRNSWGEEWGDEGYGWLPYQYVLDGMAVDWWVLLKSEWIDTGKFGV